MKLGFNHSGKELLDYETHEGVAYLWRLKMAEGKPWYAASWEPDEDGIVMLGRGEGFGLRSAQDELLRIINTPEWKARLQ